LKKRQTTPGIGLGKVCDVLHRDAGKVPLGYPTSIGGSSPTFHRHPLLATRWRHLLLTSGTRAQNQTRHPAPLPGLL